jgi:hypothetical protein
MVHKSVAGLVEMQTRMLRFLGDLVFKYRHLTDNRIDAAVALASKEE